VGGSWYLKRVLFDGREDSLMVKSIIL
jgi:hypothetical protein